MMSFLSKYIIVLFQIYLLFFQVIADHFTSNTSTSVLYGVDISTQLSSLSASCLQSEGISFVIPRGYRSSGTVDPAVCYSIVAAANAGIITRDTYLFPCPTCSKSAATQMSELINFLNSNCKSTWSGRIWLDIEGSQYWTGSTNSNKIWYQALVDSCKTYDVMCGVCSSAHQWSSIFGSASYVYGNFLPLWYAQNNSNSSFSDFSSFGGWRSPNAKQYHYSQSQSKESNLAFCLNNPKMKMIYFGYDVWKIETMIST